MPCNVNIEDKIENLSLLKWFITNTNWVPGLQRLIIMQETKSVKVT